MKVQDAKRLVRIREWTEQINACKQSGMTVKQWCKENGINTKTYYNRMKRVREELLDALETVNGGRLPGFVQMDRNTTLMQQELPGSIGSIQSEQMDMPVFAALPIPRRSGSAVTVHIGAHVAEIHNGADAETMEGVLRTLARL